MTNKNTCEICGKSTPRLRGIWYGALDGLRWVQACEECRKVDEYIKGERGEKDAHTDGEAARNDRRMG